MPTRRTSFLFDLDGTLVDSVYQHVLAWHEALEAEGISLSVWRIHRRIGMSGGLLFNMLLRETGLDIDTARRERLRHGHAVAYRRYAASIRPLPGALALLAYLAHEDIAFAIATSGRRETAKLVLDRLDLGIVTVPVITRDQVKHGKLDPDLFIVAAERLGISVETATIVGDRVWDMLAATRARALGSEQSGAYRIYQDPADLLQHIDEDGGRQYATAASKELTHDLGSQRWAGKMANDVRPDEAWVGPAGRKDGSRRAAAYRAPAESS